MPPCRRWRRSSSTSARADQGVATHQVVLGRLAQAEVDVQGLYLFQQQRSLARRSVSAPTARRSAGKGERRPRPVPEKRIASSSEGSSAQRGRDSSISSGPRWPNCSRNASRDRSPRPDRARRRPGRNSGSGCTPITSSRVSSRAASAPSTTASFCSRPARVSAASAVGLRLSRAKSTRVRRHPVTRRPARSAASSRRARSSLGGAASTPREGRGDLARGTRRRTSVMQALPLTGRRAIICSMIQGSRTGMQQPERPREARRVDARARIEGLAGVGLERREGVLEGQPAGSAAAARG